MILWQILSGSDTRTLKSCVRKIISMWTRPAVYTLTSNRESGFGRYDVMLEPKNPDDDAVILEFKVKNKIEKSLSDTVKAAIEQIDRKNYAAVLLEKGFREEQIRKYGFAFEGKRVQIGKKTLRGEPTSESLQFMA